MGFLDAHVDADTNQMLAEVLLAVTFWYLRSTLLDIYYFRSTNEVVRRPRGFNSTHLEAISGCFLDAIAIRRYVQLFRSRVLDNKLSDHGRRSANEALTLIFALYCGEDV